VSAPSQSARAPSALLGWRALGRFWLAVLGAGAAAAAFAQWLGPVTQGPANAPPGGGRVVQPLAVTPIPPAPRGVAPTAGLGPAAPAPIAAPDPALLEPSTLFPGSFLPRIAADGRAPMRVYAAPFNAADPRPRAALLVGGIGMSDAESEEAIRALPAAVSLAISPYAFRPDHVLASARSAGHELFLSLPLEPARYPLDDPGDHALLTGNAPAVNAQLLEWALTRFAGYVGATGALAGMRGERFAGSADLMDPLLLALAGRGLLYIDPRPGDGRLPYAAGRRIDVVIDEPAVRSEIDARLAQLEQMARDRGAALGIVDAPRPVTLDRIAAWAATLGSRGVALAPVTAIAQLPPAPAPSGAAASARP
jgi:polysaccharide deacetylase 2 family uncharacterized protein YibQ